MIIIILYPCASCGNGSKDGCQFKKKSVILTHTVGSSCVNNISTCTSVYIAVQ